MDWLTNPEVWASLLTLAALEIVLGIDNLIFIAVVAAKLPDEMRDRARKVGLAAALLIRIGLLAGITWIIGLTEPVFTVFQIAFSWRDIILFAGGLFLLAKGTMEIHHTVEGEEGTTDRKGAHTLAAAVAQIMVIDVVFSLDSIITAVGMSNMLGVMIAAVVIAMAIMLFAARPVSEFIERHPTAKMLALSFLLLVGMALVADGLHYHIPRGYLYFAIAFSIVVESFNLMARRRQQARVRPTRENR